MCRTEEDCGCGCHHGGYGHREHRMGFGFPMMSIEEEEVKTLEETKELLEKRLEDVNKRIELLKH